MTKVRDRKRVTGSDESAPAGLESLRWELQELGLRPYAARLLLALLRAGAGSSAELAELSGVPRTSVYQVMEALTEQGLAQPVPTYGPAVWSCPGWEAVVDILDATEEERVRRHHEKTERLRQELAALPSKLSA